METIIRYRYHHSRNAWGGWTYDQGGNTLETMVGQLSTVLQKDEGKTYTTVEIQTLQVVGPTTRLEVTKKVHVDQTQVRADS